MKFVKLLGTFKNGLVSPRVRGTVESEKEVFNSAEEITNFYVDKVGAANKRGALDAFPIMTKAEPTYTKQTFVIDILGSTYIFAFDFFYAFNNTLSTPPILAGNSRFLTITDTLGSPQKTEVLGGTNGNAQVNYWNANNGIDSGLTTYLGQSFGDFDSFDRILQYEKVTDRTVIFTTTSFSFAVSLMDYKDTTSSYNIIRRKFFILPYFVSLPIFLESIIAPTLPAKCPIVPSNFPFNPINADTVVTVSFAIIAGQSGSVPSDGVVSKSNEQFVWRLSAPSVMGELQGRFISVPNAASTKDVVFFVTELESTATPTYTYRCIQVIGGTPLAATSLWRLSTWGDEAGHPKAVGYCFGRLLYGNSGIDTSRWWASATHPSQPLYFQGFMQDNLRQDASSDTSGIYYNDITTYTTGDLFRFGFSDFVPNSSSISWIKSRRRIHFGALNGECQLEINSSGFGVLSYSQYEVGSNSANAIQAVDGDRKIFYIANNQRDIRYISTEDKDYESIDGLISTLIEGIGIRFTKIAWYERENILLCLSEDKKLYFLSIHSDTNIKAMSLFKTEYDIEDFACNTDFIVIVMIINSVVNYFSLTIADGVFFGDFYEKITTPLLGGSSDILTNKLINIYFEGVVYENFQTGTTAPLFNTVSGADPLPFDGSTISANNPAYFYLQPVTARIKSMPFDEGAQFGSAVGSTHRVDRVVFQLDKSGPMSAGESFDNLHPVEGLDGTPRTGLFKQDFPQSPDIEAVLCIESTTPTPLHISGVSLRGVSYEGE